MGNWYRNAIKATGIEKLDIFDSENNNTIDFNKIFPEPETKEECPKEFLFTVENPDHIEQMKNKPWFNWYKWRNKFWGVHANTAFDKGDMSATTAGETIFDTKCGAPYTIIAKISKMLGDELLTHECLDIDTIYDTIIRTVWKNGKMIEAYQSVFEYDLESEDSDGKYGEFTPIDTTNTYDIQ